MTAIVPPTAAICRGFGRLSLEVAPADDFSASRDWLFSITSSG